MGKSKRYRPNRNTKLQKLTMLCFKYFGNDFKHWNWEVDSGNIDGFPMKIAAAIELPKEGICGNIFYTDPFIAKSGGASKSLEIACDYATDWMVSKFECT